MSYCHVFYFQTGKKKPPKIKLPLRYKCWPWQGPFVGLNLSSFSSNASGKLDVFGHNCHSLSMDCAQVGVFEQTHQVGLTSLLQSHHGRALEPKVRLKVLSNLTNKSLERKLADQQFGALLIPTDLTKSNCARPVTMRFLYTSRSRSTLSCSFGSKLLPWSLPSCRLTCSLFSTSHLYITPTRSLVEVYSRLQNEHVIKPFSMLLTSRHWLVLSGNGRAVPPRPLIPVIGQFKWEFYIKWAGLENFVSFYIEPSTYEHHDWSR